MDPDWTIINYRIKHRVTKCHATGNAHQRANQKKPEITKKKNAERKEAINIRQCVDINA